MKHLAAKESDIFCCWRPNLKLIERDQDDLKEGNRSLLSAQLVCTDQNNNKKIIDRQHYLGDTKDFVI